MPETKNKRSWVGELTGISPLISGFSGPWKSFSALLKMTPYGLLTPGQRRGGRVPGNTPEERFEAESRRAKLSELALEKLETNLAYRAVFLGGLALLAWGYSLSFLFEEVRNHAAAVGLAQNFYVILFPAAIGVMAIRDYLRMYQVRYRALVTFPELVGRLIVELKAQKGGHRKPGITPPSVKNTLFFILSATALSILWPHILYAQTVSAGAAGPVDMGQSTTTLSGAYGTLSELGSSDLSGQWLARLFPSLSGGSSTDQLSSLLSSFNTILLDAGTGLAFWQGSLGIIFAAQNGSLEGSNIHAVISPLRTLIGAGALFPVVGGYCLMQMFALQVLGGGYWMADQLYGSMLAFNASAATPSTNNMAFDKMKPLITSVLEIETCYAWYADNSADAQADGVSQEFSYFAESNGVANSSSVATTPPTFTSSGTNAYIANFGVCGTLSVGSAANTDPNATTAVQGGSAFDTSRNSQLDSFISSVWSSGLPQALAGIFTANGGATVGQSATAAPTASKLSSDYATVTTAGTTYLNDLETDAKTLTSAGLTPFGTAVQTSGTSLGWVSAGALYNVISQVYTRSAGAVDGSIPSLTLTSLEGTAPDDIEKVHGAYAEADEFMASGILPTVPTMTESGAQAVSSSSGGSSGTLAPVLPTTSGTTLSGTEAIQQVLNTPAAGILFALDNDLQIDPANPMASVTTEGLFFLHGGEAIVGAVGAVKVAQAVSNMTGVGRAATEAAGVANSMTGGALDGAFAKIASLAVILGEILIIVGAFEAFVIPMLFYIAWMFQIVNCIAFAAEFVLAAPLAAYQFMRINGTEAIGQEQRAFFIIAFMQGFLRPSLLIFGLAISTYVFSAIAGVLNATFNLAVAAEQGGDIVGPVKIVTFVLMLVFIQWQLCVRSISLIGRVPDAVADLVGGGLGRLGGGEEQALGVAGAASTRLRGVTGGAIGYMLGSSKQAVKPASGNSTPTSQGDLGGQS